MGKRIHLCEYETNDLTEGLNELFEQKIEIPRMRYGFSQTLDTLINEEALLLARFLRNEKETWIPRIASLNQWK
jgi:CRISPR/Cas system-associated endonuclease Cas1